jgi:hypothetical protein
MKKQSYLIIIMWTCQICMAQNLVPNSNFETFSGCPGFYHQLDLAIPWINTSTGAGRSEYLNSCATSPNVSVPSNTFGFQIAHTGEGYCGLYMFNYGTGVPNFREYIEAPLSQSLTAGNTYYFQMFMALANGSKFTTDDFGVYLSDTLVSGINNFYPLPFTPQIINSSGVITDTVNWTKVSGNYIATGSENYLIIGNFKNDTNTNMISINTSGNVDGAYFYIDDICIASDSLDCITMVGINDINITEDFRCFPNPFSEKLSIVIRNNKFSEIILYDIASRKILQKKFINTITINTEQLEKGIYIYEVRIGAGLFKKGKVINH